MKNNLINQYLLVCSIQLSEKQKQERTKEVMNCHHEFVMLKPRVYNGAFNSSDCEIVDPVVECVHCGVSNKFSYLYEKLLFNGYIRHDSDNKAYLVGSKFDLTDDVLVEHYPLESELFGKYVISPYVKLLGIKEPQYENPDMVIDSCHIKVLYQLAKEDSLTDEEIFNNMKELYNLENYYERLMTKSIDDTKALKERYNECRLILKKHQ
jgi:hypothetical protein